MRAAQVVATDGPDGIEIREVEAPGPAAVSEPGSGVLIEVAACGVGFPDLLLSQGAYQYRPEPPFAPGIEVAGTVAAAAPDSGFEAGERVAAYLNYGGMAERVVAPQGTTFRLPDSIDFVEGAGLVVNYHTAYLALALRGRLQAGEKALIHGAAGGVGSAAIQITAGLGATPIAVVSSPEKAEFARRCGAELVIGGAGTEWTEELTEIAPDGVDVVLDPVGGDRPKQSFKFLRPQGSRIVIVGFAAGEIPKIGANRILFANCEVSGAAWGAVASVDAAVANRIGAAVDSLVAEGAIRPMIGRSLPLSEVGDALRGIGNRQALGKVVVTM